MIGVNPSTVSRQAAAGLIPMVNGKIDPVAASEARSQNIDWSKSRRGVPQPKDAVERGNEASYNAARARSMIAKAEMDELELAKVKGEVVTKEDMAAQAQRTARMVRDRLMALPRQLSGSLVAMTNEREIEALLAERLSACLTAAAEEVELMDEDMDDAAAIDS